MNKGYSAISGLEKLTPEEIKQRNLETYGSNIRKYRAKAGMSVDQLAEVLRISKSSIRNWECGLTRPDPEYLYRMFSILDVEPNEFFGFQGIGTLLSPSEKALLEHYRALDETGKEDLNAIAEAMSIQVQGRKMRGIYHRIARLPDYGRCAAAGNGVDWPDYADETEVLLFNSPLVNQADEIITVNGSSMEPQYFDGDKVLVEHCSELHNGDIGIFFVRGVGGVIKQKAYDRLHSLNPDYDDILPFEDGADVIGRVLGKIERSMLPSPEEKRLYHEACALLEG